MVFSDLFFIFAFLPTFALMYCLTSLADKHLLKATAEGNTRFTLRNITLVIFSLIFYAWGEPVYLFLMLICVLLNYFAGLGIASNRRRKMWLAIGVAQNLAILGVFKYLGFFGTILADFGLNVNVPQLALPIGISFYIFQSISYLVDVYRNEAPVQRRFVDLLLYISLFPQLIAGPIIRYGTVAKEIHNRRATTQDIADGVYRFVIGLGKKVILANIFSELADKFLLNGLDSLSMWGAWIGLLAFALQIYFDFSAYSDMAIGLGRAVGFHFCENFNHPYCSRTITDFWRRWHMSLGSFFRDYVYIPMGGNRRHQALNILTVWFLTGMWHGASWNFIIWGMYYGLVLVIEKFTILRAPFKIPSPLLHIYSLLLILIGWGIFYFTDFSSLATFFHALVGGNGAVWSFVEESAVTDYFWIWVAGVLLCMPIRGRIEAFVDNRLAKVAYVGPAAAAILRATVSIFILLTSVALLVGATNNAFIYTRF